MAVDAEGLVIRPFNEVVQQGQNAISNAQSTLDDDELSEQMTKAGRALVREGERSLQRLQPMWNRNVGTFGSAFKDAVLANDDIERKRRLLGDLLYDFEDYVELDTFDQSKFTELQVASKSLALDLLEFARRLKLEAPKAADPPPVVFPPLPPLPPIPPDRKRSALAGRPRSSRKPDHPRQVVNIDGISRPSANEAGGHRDYKSQKGQQALVVPLTRSYKFPRGEIVDVQKSGAAGRPLHRTQQPTVDVVEEQRQGMRSPVRPSRYAKGTWSLVPRASMVGKQA